ncbi:EAL domain-containing protein [Rhodococcoides kyotonense]|uniref:EAL domain, c-di-GMP-specific phosphodiesterase class I (Or its enzymatically inactive variant) n=1 Tax=Rhodococcoides kyotonense TaxID=398843 RepID=A0A239LIC3_9NOCA|nr:EAL domain-containing protein [Rhodococcus kyotonensis]SNT30050.1 EAL domain, c-di-GMP-specific phosphodiesterase class I (or its enzymatically inactive variant) [Rhodococcus kyotonensis]
MPSARKPAAQLDKEPSELLGLEVSMQFAPVRRLDDAALAAVELQLRGPDGTALASAEAVRRAAQMMDQRADYDGLKLAKSRSSVASAVAGQLPLLVTVDSQSQIALDSGVGPERIVVTVNVSDVLTNPHDALRRVQAARSHGRLIALDGVGVEAHAATLLSLVEPDIVITAREFITRTIDFEIGSLAHALAAYVERTHAVVIAEGIDDDSARLSARTIGATYGIGALYPAVSDPKVLLHENVVAIPNSPVWSTPATDASTPYNIVRENMESRRGTKRLLVQMSKTLESQAVAMGSSMLVLGTFQRAEHFTTTTAQRWRHMSESIGFAGVYGVGLSHMLDGRIQHAPLDPDDELVDEWTVVVLGPHHSALLSARDRHDNGPDLERTFDFVQTYDRTTVVQAAHSIMRRFVTA